MAQDEKISIFGTSAGYLTALMASDVTPRNDYTLDSLKTILSTGSPLSAEGFEFVYDKIKSDVQLASISGGTDLNGCFALGNPMGPVYSGELQCRGLGMKVEAFDEDGKSLVNKQGELVCTAPFPSMPIHFWDDPDNEKYHKAYFDVYSNIWRHGDFIEINDRGGVIIYGRSDTTLNPGGVRIGTAEIYRQMDQFEEIEDSIVIGQTMANDIRVILFVQLKKGITIDPDLKERITGAIRRNASPRHVPAAIISVPEIPYTLNMKKVELAVKHTVEGRPVLNKEALKNPDALTYYENIKELQ
jgi:acetoacetyl-CoA synthetase